MAAQNAPTTVDLSKYIERRFFGERPHIRDHRIPVANIARRIQLNQWTVADAAEDFTLSEVEVLAALLYYEQHKDEIDAQEAQEQRLFEEMKRQHGQS